MPDDDAIPQPNLSNEVDDPKAARAAFLSAPPAVLPAEVAAPVVDDEAAALDELTNPPAAGEAAPPSTTAGGPSAAADPYAEFGGRDRVVQALELDGALRTEQGVKLVIRQGLEALGYTDAQIRAALGGGPGQPVSSSDVPPAPVANDPFAGIEDDDVVTGSDLKRIVSDAVTAATTQATAAAQAALDPVRQAFEQERVREQAGRNDQTLVELLGPVPTEPAELAAYQAQARDLLTASARYVEPGNFDPNHIRAGITKAHAEIVDTAEKRYKAYLADKRKARDSAPANIGGHTAGDSPEPEPKNLAEARAQARAAGLFG